MKIYIFLVLLLISFSIFSQEINSDYIEGEISLYDMITKWRAVNGKTGIGTYFLTKEKGNKKYYFYVFVSNNKKTNFGTQILIKEDGIEKWYYKINYNSEKGNTPEWFDNNKDGIKQDDEIFYLWY